MKLYTILVDETSETLLTCNASSHGGNILAKTLDDGIRALMEIQRNDREPEKPCRKIDRPEFKTWYVMRRAVADRMLTTSDVVYDQRICDDDSNTICTVSNDIADLMAAAPDAMRGIIRAVNRFFGSAKGLVDMHNCMEILRNIVHEAKFEEDLE